jgi:hypothetical protein
VEAPDKPVSLKGQIPSHSFAGGSIVALRRVKGGAKLELAENEREQLLADALAGKFVQLTIDAIVYVQKPNEPNRHYTRVRDGRRSSFAASFAGLPYMRDHEHNNALARGGRIVDSKAEDLDGGGWHIRQELELTAPWAVEAALRGLIDRFSISYESTGDMVCSICGEPMIRGWFSVWTECEHDFGAEYDGVVCQLEVTDAVGLETSSVSVPAVLGTDVDSIRQALSAKRAPEPARKDTTMLKRLLPILALAATASEDEAVTAVEGLKLQLGAKDQEIETLRTGLRAAQEKLAAQETAQLGRDTEALIERGVAEGRFSFKRNEKGERVETPIEKTIRHIAKNGGLEAAAQFVNQIEPTLPVGRSQVETTETKSSASPTTNPAVGLSAAEIRWCQKNGVKPEDYLKTKNGEQVARPGASA